MHILCSNVSIEAKQVMENIGIFEYFTNVTVSSYCNSSQEKCNLFLLFIYIVCL